jgi:WD40 repeat protein
MREMKAKSCWVENVVWIHSKSILAFSSGKYLTCCTLSGDTATEYPAASSTISDLKWSHSFDCLLVCYYGAVALVHPDKPNFSVELEDKGSFVSVGSSNNHLLIASGMQDQMISIWGLFQDRKLIPGKKKSIETMKEVDFTTFRIQYPGKVSQIDFNGSGQMMAGTGGSQLIVWNFGPGGAYMLGENGAKNTVFFSHRSRINHVAFHTRLKYVASMDEDGLLFIWSLDTARANYVRTSKFHFDGQKSDGLTFEWSKDGNYLAAAFGDGIVHIFNPCLSS